MDQIKRSGTKRRVAPKRRRCAPLVPEQAALRAASSEGKLGPEGTKDIFDRDEAGDAREAEPAAKSSTAERFDRACEASSAARVLQSRKSASDRVVINTPSSIANRATAVYTDLCPYCAFILTAHTIRSRPQQRKRESKTIGSCKCTANRDRSKTQGSRHKTCDQRLIGRCDPLADEFAGDAVNVKNLAPVPPDTMMNAAQAGQARHRHRRSRRSSCE